MSTPTNDSQYVPAPWRNEKPKIAGGYPALGDGTPYFEIKAGCGHAGGNERGFQFTGYMSDADASLIIAAPELLEALEGMLDLWEDYQSEECHCSAEDLKIKCELCNARAAIAKARNLSTRPADDDGLEPQSSTRSSEKQESGGFVIIEEVAL